MSAGAGARSNAIRLRRTRLAAAAVLFASLAAVPSASLAWAPATAQAAAAPVGAARLQGSFNMSGRVTAAVNVRGERRGAAVHRVWTFLPRCPVGSCGRVMLVRHRAHGTDQVMLRRRAPGRYTGRGSFTAPLECGGRVYHAGQRVRFTITVRVTDAVMVGTVTVALRIAATYVNPVRINLTPCVAFLGHDAARYHGLLTLGG